MASLMQGLGFHATGGLASPTRIVQSQILDGSGGKNTALVVWLQNYFGATVTPVPAPTAGPSITVVLGSNFTIKTFPYH
jgi:hypothetical protein